MRFGAFRALAISVGKRAGAPLSESVELARRAEAAGFGIVAASERPRTFIVPSDPDFTALLNDPVTGGIEYLLAVPPTGRGASDVLNLRYPTLYDTGADIATLELEVPNNGDSQPTWRLYRVNKPVPAS